MAKGKALDRCKRIPLAEAAAEPSGSGYYELLADRYWQVIDGCILMFDGWAPQCNSSESITKRLTGDVGEVRFLPRVWLKHSCDGGRV